MSCSYEMKGFPHICLIDTEGFIVFAGYPSEREDIEHDISTLLQGDRLTGKGTLDLGWDRADCASDDQVAKLLNDTALFNDSIKPEAQGMQRAFLNYDVDQFFNMRTMKTRNDIVVW